MEGEASETFGDSEKMDSEGICCFCCGLLADTMFEYKRGLSFRATTSLKDLCSQQGELRWKVDESGTEIKKINLILLQ